MTQSADRDLFGERVRRLHWPGCSKPVPPSMWGCKPHWFALPKHLRARIWATYRPGQEVTKTPSPQYIEAAKAVRDWIAAQSTPGRVRRCAVKRIVSAAIQHPDGHIIAGPRHFDETMFKLIQLTGLDWRTAKQGFIDADGVFHERPEAWVIAEHFGQIVRDPAWQTGTLHSEHLY